MDNKGVEVVRFITKPFPFNQLMHPNRGSDYLANKLQQTVCIMPLRA
jgi:hypothetical protein